jgi:transcriptional regulator with XRE-family HTH domain
MDSFPTILRRWRAHARLSQLALAAEADVSARHLACLETGRARPSRAMVLRLARALAAPPEGSNALLGAAGFAPAHPQTPLDDAALAPVRQAFLGLLAAHDPNPGFLLDRVWRLVEMNAAAGRLLGALGLGQGDSLLDLLGQPDRARAVVVNWPEVGQHLLARLRAESRAAGGIDALDRAAARLAADPLVVRPHGQGGGRPGPVLPTILALGDRRLALWSMLVQPGGAVDLTVTDLKLELLFPLDPETARLLQAMAHPVGPVEV